MDETKKPLVVAVANYKGGSAKSTSCVNLAAVLAEQNRVLVINVDTQPHVELLSGLDGFSDLEQKNALNLFLPTGYQTPSSQVIPSEYGFDVIGCGPEMVSAETHIQNSPMGEQRLALLFDADKDALSAYDIILIDTIGSRSRLVNAALIAADEVVIPVRPGMLDASELGKFIEFLDALTLARMGRGPIKYRGVFLAQVQMAGSSTTVASRYARMELVEAFAERLPICETFIPQTAATATASYLRGPMVKVVEDDKASHAYRSLAVELFPEFAANGKVRAHG